MQNSRLNWLYVDWMTSIGCAPSYIYRGRSGPFYKSKSPKIPHRSRVFSRTRLHWTVWYVLPDCPATPDCPALPTGQSGERPGQACPIWCSTHVPLPFGEEQEPKAPRLSIDSEQYTGIRPEAQTKPDTTYRLFLSILPDTRVIPLQEATIQRLGQSSSL